jgi:hypothetical protein
MEEISDKYLRALREELKARQSGWPDLPRHRSPPARAQAARACNGTFADVPPATASALLDEARKSLA